MQKNVKIVIGVLVVIAVLVVVLYNFYGTNQNLQAQIGMSVPQSQIQQLQSIANNNTLANRVGLGIDQNYPKQINGTEISNSPATLLYIGAEYCPFCAATRWGLILALMRFGNISGLKYMASSSTDVYPSTPTFTFVNATYSSQYINFQHVEIQNRTEATLQIPTPTQNATYGAYDGGGGIPFIDFNNKSIQSGASFSPGILQNMNWNQIIAQLNNPNSTIGQGIIGDANIFTAQICKVNGMQPTSVCSQPYVATINNQI